MPPEPPKNIKAAPPVHSVSIIIPVYNGGKAFRRCIESIQACSPRPGEVIVAADGDTDGSSQFAESLNLKVVRNETCCGAAAARNLGARHATGDILLFIDADILVQPDIIARVSKALAHDRPIAAVFGSYDDTPYEPNLLSQYKNLQHHFTHQTARNEASTFWSGCGAIRRKVFRQLGGFDESYGRPCIEDIELGFRIKKAGFRIRLLKSLSVKHLKRWQAHSLFKTDFFDRALPWTELIYREKQFKNDLNINISSRICVVCALLMLPVFTAATVNWRFWPAGLALVLLMLGLNAGMYNFMARKRGILFAVKIIPWHWFYFCYSGVAFAVGSMRYAWRSAFARRL